jgi:hypothetical protein
VNEMMELENLKIEVCTVKNNEEIALSKKRAGSVKNSSPNLKVKDRGRKILPL